LYIVKSNKIQITKKITKLWKWTKAESNLKFEQNDGSGKDARKSQYTTLDNELLNVGDDAK
jgi:hypothetical protein